MTETNCTVQNRPKNLIKGFLYGFYFPIVICAWAVFCYLFDMQDLGLFVLIGIAGLILVTFNDITPIIPLFTCFVLVVRDYAPLTTLPYIVAYIFLFTCIAVHFIFFPVKGVYLGKLFFPLALVSAALLLGGVLSTHVSNYVHGLASALAVGPAVLFIYVLFLNGINPPKNFDIKIYLSTCMIITTVFAGFELLFIKNIYLLFMEELPYPITDLSFGWGNVNTLAAMILIAVPLCAFIAIRTKRLLSCLSVVVYLIAILYITGSDACQGILLFSLPFIALQMIIWSKHGFRRKLIVLTCLAFIFAAAAGIAVINYVPLQEIKELVLVKAYDNGRSKIYKKAFDLFKQNPIFGVGLGYKDDSSYTITNGRYNFHSTFFHVMATTGSVGIIAYAIYYFAQLKIILNKKTDFNAFGFISILLLESYGIIDICRFNVIPLVSYITLITLLLELDKFKAEASRLPLLDKFKCKYKRSTF